MKKSLAKLLAGTMLVSAAMSTAAMAEELPEAIEPGAVVKATPDMYPDTDLSKEDTVYIYLIGDTPNDFDQIVEKANEYLADFNTKLDFTIMPWSDYQNLYSLNLTSGTNIDLIFTAPWCYLWTEASKGSFMTLSEDFISTYMPLSDKYQLESSWDGVKLNGEIIAVPQNATNPNGKIVAIRQDLADKYEISELKSWEDYKNFCLTIAEKETPESGIFGMAASGGNDELWDVYRQQYDTMYAVQDGKINFIYSYNGGIPAPDEIGLAWSQDYFLSFCEDMREMAQAGVWSRSALTNEVSDDDAFGALAGASIAWNTSVFTYIEMAEKTEGVECAAYDITQENFAIGEAYNNNDMAITASSPRPERAAMVLDLIKNDTYLNHLFRLGIEDVHYTIDENGIYTELEKSADYPVDNLSMCWAVKNGDIEQAGVDARKQAIIDEEKAKMVACPTEGFVFDDASVQFEVQAVNAILDEYIPSLQLGLFENPSDVINQMLSDIESAGYSAVEEEFMNQYTAWYESMQ